MVNTQKALSTAHTKYSINSRYIVNIVVCAGSVAKLYPTLCDSMYQAP